MKVFLSALTILLIISCITFGVSDYTSKKADFFFSRIEEMNTSEKKGDLSFLQNEYESLLEEWERSYFLLSISNPHSNLLQIEESFASVIGSCKANDQNELLIHSKKLSELFKNLKNNSEFKASNIF